MNDSKRKSNAGRPRTKNTPSRIQDLLTKFSDYIEKTEIPIIQEFCYKNDIIKQDLYDNQQFSTLLKKCIAKKESALEVLSLKGQVNTTQAIFSLKQLGWRDRQEVEHSGKDGAPISLQVNFVDVKK